MRRCHSWCHSYDEGNQQTIGRWIEKAIDATRQAATVVLLVPARTDAVWFREAYERANEVRLLSGRLTFGNDTQPAPFPSCLTVMRQRQTSTYPRAAESTPSHQRLPES